jgi:hypothetical protein
VPVRCDVVWEALVVEAGTSEVLPAARIELRPPGRNTTIVVVTDDDGRVKVERGCVQARWR